MSTKRSRVWQLSNFDRWDRQIPSIPETLNSSKRDNPSAIGVSPYEQRDFSRLLEAKFTYFAVNAVVR